METMADVDVVLDALPTRWTDDLRRVAGSDWMAGEVKAGDRGLWRILGGLRQSVDCDRQMMMIYITENI